MRLIGFRINGLCICLRSNLLMSGNIILYPHSRYLMIINDKSGDWLEKEMFHIFNKSMKGGAHGGLSTAG